VPAKQLTKSRAHPAVIQCFLAEWQGSAHTGQWWSGPTTTQKILPPLSFENSFFYHHLVFKIVFLPPFGLQNVQTDQMLTTTQSSLGRTLEWGW